MATLKRLKEFFRASVEEMQDKQGFCILLNRHYATIDAVRVSCVTGNGEQIKIHWRLDFDNEGKKIFRLLDGVTGWESWYLQDLVDIGIGDKFCACAGTPGKWDELWLNPGQMKNLVNELTRV